MMTAGNVADQQQQQQQQQQQRGRRQQLWLNDKGDDSNTFKKHFHNLDMLSARLSTPRNIAMERMRALGCLTTTTTTTMDNTDIINSPNRKEEECLLEKQQKLCCNDCIVSVSFLVELLIKATTAWMSSFSGSISLHPTTAHILEWTRKKNATASSTASSTGMLSSIGDDGDGIDSFLVSETREERTDDLLQVLRLHRSVAKHDWIMAEELGRAGSHVVLSTLIQLDHTSLLDRGDQPHEGAMIDHSMEIQEIACEIGTLSRGFFPMKYSPFSDMELSTRLPLCFHLKPIVPPMEDEWHQTILIHQITDRQTAQVDVGFVMWPSAVLLSSWLMSNASLLENKEIMEIGAGCGLAGLAAAGIVIKYQLQGSTKSSTPKVILTDCNEKVLENMKRNIILNSLDDAVLADKLDFYSQTGTNAGGGWIDGNGNLRDPVDVVLATDVICQSDNAVAVANTIFDSLRPGGQAIVVSADAQHRFGVDTFEQMCTRTGLNVSMTDVSGFWNDRLIAKGNEDYCGIHQTSGYSAGMSLIMFRIEKPV